MEILKPAIAGTLESSDAQVTVEPGDVAEKTGCQIVGHFDLITKFNEGDKLFDTSHPRYVNAALGALERLDVSSARVTVVDKGALDCTLKARVECAVFRSCGASAANIPWGGAVR